MSRNKNIFKRYFDKSKKTIYDVSKETNIPEEKVQEIIDGDREISGENVDKMLSSLQNNNKVEKDITIINALEFFKENNPRDIRIKFKYNKQSDVARVLHIAPSVISQFEAGNYGPNRNSKGIGNNTLLRLYDFYRNELNINVFSEDKVKNIKKFSLPRKDKVLSDAKEFFKENSMDTLLDKYNMTPEDFMNNTSMSYSVFRRFMTGKFDKQSGMYKDYIGKNTIIKTYLYFKELESKEVEQEAVDKTITLFDTSSNPVTFDIKDEENQVESYSETNETENIDTASSFILDKNFNVNDVFEYIVYKCDSDRVIDLYDKLNNFFEIVKKFK